MWIQRQNPVPVHTTLLAWFRWGTGDNSTPYWLMVSREGGGRHGGVLILTQGSDRELTEWWYHHLSQTRTDTIPMKTLSHVSIVDRVHSKIIIVDEYNMSGTIIKNFYSLASDSVFIIANAIYLHTPSTECFLFELLFQKPLITKRFDKIRCDIYIS